jgi:hypothetical protein
MSATAAAQRGDLSSIHATLRAVVDAKADLQLADRSGRTPLVLARERGYAAMEQMLLKACER